MQITHFYHRHRLYRLKGHPDFHLFELAIWLHTLAHSLIAVFVPILLLKIGYSISSVIIYYFIFNLIDVPLNFPVARLIRRIGARRVMILGTLACIGFFALLGVLPPHSWILLVVLALLAALYDTLFWISHIYLFIEANRGGLDGGESTGALSGIRKFANVIGPALGAILLLTGGKISLVLASLVIFALSLVPLFRMKHVTDIPKTKKVTFRKFFKDITERRDYLSQALLGVQNEADDAIWPIFIFVVIGTIGSVAAIPVIVSLTTAAFAFLAGKLSKSYRVQMISIGSMLLACTWMLRLTVSSTIFYYVTAFLVGFFALLVQIPLDGSIINRGLKVGSLEAATYRNAVGMFSRLLLYGLLALTVNVFKFSFTAAALGLFLLVATNSVMTNARAKNIHRHYLPN